MRDYEMVGKGIYFPKQKILAIGDLHLGYEQKMHDEGVMFPMEQINDMIKELKGIFEEIQRREQRIEKVILLGDIKHYFDFEKQEKVALFKVIDFLRNYVDDENIILIRGNHDKFDIAGRKFLDFYKQGDLIFVHGDKEFVEIYEKDIRLVVMGHHHPTIILSDSQDVKKEKYKCFFKGKLKGKEIIIVPSFLGITLGRDTKHIELNLWNKFNSFISERVKKNFEVFVVNNNLKENALCFGKLKDL